MSNTNYLGELDELVLLTTAVLHHDGAYGFSVVKEIEDRVGRKLSLSAVHTVLYRLQDRGFVQSKMGGASKNRGGRRKRLFYVSQLGKQVIANLKSQREMFWKEIGDLGFEMELIGL